MPVEFERCQSCSCVCPCSSRLRAHFPSRSFRSPICRSRLQLSPRLFPFAALQVVRARNTRCVPLEGGTVSCDIPSLRGFYSYHYSCQVVSYMTLKLQPPTPRTFQLKEYLALYRMQKYGLSISPQTVGITTSRSFTGIRDTKNCGNKDFITPKYF